MSFIEIKKDVVVNKNLIRYFRFSTREGGNGSKIYLDVSFYIKDIKDPVVSSFVIYDTSTCSYKAFLEAFSDGPNPYDPKENQRSMANHGSQILFKEQEGLDLKVKEAVIYFLSNFNSGRLPLYIEDKIKEHKKDKAEEYKREDDKLVKEEKKKKTIWNKIFNWRKKNNVDKMELKCD